MKFVKIVAPFLFFSFFNALVASSKSVDTEAEVAPAFRTIDVERELNADCKTFTFNETPLQYKLLDGTGPNNYSLYSGPDNYSAADGESLTDYCAIHDCCSRGVDTDPAQLGALECAYWSTDPLVSYKLCPGSCQGNRACYGIAANSLAGTTVDIGSSSCRGSTTCYSIALYSKAKSIVIGSNSCRKGASCMSNSCTDDSSCYFLASGGKSLAQVSVPSNECNNELNRPERGCGRCGSESTFDGIFKATEECCSAQTDEYYRLDAACNVDGDFNLCSDDNSSMFYVNWLEKYVSCAWLSPTNKKKAKKRQATHCARGEVKSMCLKTCATDDDSYSFTLLNGSGRTKNCAWLTKNAKKANKRVSKYCKDDFDGGKLVAACTKSCGLCPETLPLSF